MNPHMHWEGEEMWVCVKCSIWPSGGLGHQVCRMEGSGWMWRELPLISKVQFFLTRPSTQYSGLREERPVRVRT